MKECDVTVKIIGKVGSGKSAIAALLARQLSYYNIECYIVGEDTPLSKIEATLEKRIGAIADKGKKVKIEMIQSKREQHV